MPEGHVIHRLARELQHHFAGRPVAVSSPQGRFHSEATQLDQHQLLRAEAYGKHLFLEFELPAPEHIVHIHLGLIGTFSLEDATTQRGIIRFRMSNGDIAANLRGPQWCRLITPAEFEHSVAKLGADPLRAEADPDAYLAKVARSGRSIGSLLMDQSLFAGVGSIYRTETLFRLGIHPLRPGKTLDVETLHAIWEDLRVLMDDGVEKGRIDTVLPEHMPEAMGRAPRKDDHGGEVYVYRRAGSRCYKCDTPIDVAMIDGRKAFFCPTCQGEQRQALLPDDPR